MLSIIDRPRIETIEKALAEQQTALNRSNTRSHFFYNLIADL